MRTLRKFLLIISMVLILFPSNSYADIAANTNNNSPNATSPSSSPPTFLFVQTAGVGIFSQVGQSDKYTLTLNQADPWITYFSNVPHRITNFMRMDDFINVFNKNIEQENLKGLNAGIIALTPKTHQTLRYAVSLFNPQYYPKSAAVTYEVKALPGEQLNSIQDNQTFQHVALFIDSACLSCVGP